MNSWKAIEIPIPSTSQRIAYLKYQLKERPTLGLALVLDIDGDNIKEANGGGRQCQRRADAIRAKPMASWQGPKAQVEGQLAEAADALAQAADPVDDLEGGADYKRHLIGVFLKRAFVKALS